MELDTEALIRLLNLRPLPQEGGYYSETHRAARIIDETALGGDYVGDRNASTAIYFLLTPEEYSALHILPTDEVFHFYLGDPVEMLQLHPDGTADKHVLGIDLPSGMRPQVIVPGKTWQGCKLRGGGRLALLGCTVAPGFDFRDFHVATREEIAFLSKQFPAHATTIRDLAPKS